MSSNGKLTPRQQRAIVSLLESPTIEAASKNAGVSRSTLHEWLKIPAFQEELERAKRSQFQAAVGQLRSLVPEAIQGLKDLARSSSEQIRLRACVEILKATNAYGSQAPLPFTLADSALEVSTNQKGKIALEILERLMSGEIPANAVPKLFQVLDKLEDLDGGPIHSQQKPKIDLSDLSDEALDLIEEIGLNISLNRA
ncbi:hypothetical protein MYX64_00915 [Nitrospinae bacterium AH_259_B05_G02_I21]|nr:hypothetical protein [Nitrospinae bacterium AH_259_B05_G02_I21]MDA2932369.1 hypothetical protein [Nitrospinae bacterium AH-259-F20]